MYNRTQVKSDAKQSLHMNLGVAIGTSIVGSLILGAIGMVPAVGSLATVILTGVISTGLAIVFLEIIRNSQVDFSDLFKGFSNFGTTCLAGILTAVFTALWSLLFVIPGIIKSYSYAMTYYILADNPDMKPLDAITASRQMMEGHKLDLFVLHLSFFWWYLLCGVTFGIAYIYVGPYVSAAVAKFYETIKAEKTSDVSAAESNIND